MIAEASTGSGTLGLISTFAPMLASRTLRAWLAQTHPGTPGLNGG